MGRGACLQDRAHASRGGNSRAVMMRLGLGLGLPRSRKPVSGGGGGAGTAFSLDLDYVAPNGSPFVLDLAYEPPNSSPFQLTLAYVPPNGTVFELSLAFVPPNGSQATLNLNTVGWDDNATNITFYGPAGSDNYSWDGSGFQFTGGSGISSCSWSEIIAIQDGSGYSYSTDGQSNIDSQITFVDGIDNTGWDGNITIVTVRGPGGSNDSYGFNGATFYPDGGTGMSTCGTTTITGLHQGAGYSYTTDGASNADGWITFTDGTVGTGWDGKSTNVTVTGPTGWDIYTFSAGAFTFNSGTHMSSASGATLTGNTGGSGYSYSTDNASNADGWITFDDGVNNSGWDGTSTNVTVTGPAGADVYTFSEGTFSFESGSGMSSASGSAITGAADGSGYSYSTDHASNADSWISFTDGTNGAGWDGIATNVTVTGPAGTDYYSFSAGTFTFEGGAGMSTASGATIVGHTVGRGYSYSTDGASNADGWITFTDGTNR